MPGKVPTFRRRSVPTLQPKRSASDVEWKRFLQTNRWRQFSERYRRRHPSCVMCWSRGMLVPAQHVHHRDGQDPEKAFIEACLAPLCHSHHSVVTLAERRGKPIAIPTAEPVAPEEPDGHYC